MIKKMAGKAVASNSSLLSSILELDKLNMKPTLAESGFFEFPLEKRLANLKLQTTQVFVDLEDDSPFGYLEICRDKKDPKDLYLTSIQIHPDHWGTLVFRDLILSAISW